MATLNLEFSLPDLDFKREHGTVADGQSDSCSDINSGASKNLDIVLKDFFLEVKISYYKCNRTIHSSVQFQ